MAIKYSGSRIILTDETAADFLKKQKNPNPVNFKNRDLYIAHLKKRINVIKTSPKSEKVIYSNTQE